MNGLHVDPLPAGWINKFLNQEPTKKKKDGNSVPLWAMWLEWRMKFTSVV